MSRTWETDGVTHHPVWLLGIARSDADRVAVDQSPDWNNETVLDAADGSYWGTWMLSLADSGRPATVTVDRKGGEVDSAVVETRTQGERITEIPG